MPFVLILLALVCVSLLFTGKIKSSKDYLVAGRSLPMIVVAFTMAATQFGGGALVGGIQQGTQSGFYPAMYTILGMAAACFVNSFVAGKYREFGDSITPPDFIEARYGACSFLRGYHSFVFIFTLIAICTSQIISFASMASAMGMSYRAGVLLCAGVVIVFTIMSGMWGVASTDMVQFLCCLILLPIVAYMALRNLGGEGNTLLEMAREPFFADKEAVSSFLYTNVPAVVGSMFSYEFFMRFQSARNPKEAKRASLTAGGILLLTALPIGILGGVGHRMFSTAASNEVLGIIVGQTLPKWAGYLFIAVILAALLTTADSVLTSLSGIITRDFYNKLLHPKREMHELPHSLALARGTVVVATGIAAYAALNFTQILKVSFYFSPFTTGVMFAPMVIGLYWKRASRTGAIVSVVCGAAAAVLQFLGVIVLFERVMGIMLIGSIAMVAASLLFPDPPKAEALQAAGPEGKKA